MHELNQKSEKKRTEEASSVRIFVLTKLKA